MTDKHFGPAEVRGTTLDASTRTVDVVWATSAPVARWSPTRGSFMERLSMRPEHIRMERFAAGMSLLDSHDSNSMDDRLGTVVPGTVLIENGKGLAKVKLSRKQRAEELLQDLKDGHPFPVSVGYRVHAYRLLDDSREVHVLEAVIWGPLEISAVPVPADGGAHSRAASGGSVGVIAVRMRMRQRATFG